MHTYVVEILAEGSAFQVEVETDSTIEIYKAELARKIQVGELLEFHRVDPNSLLVVSSKKIIGVTISDHNEYQRAIEKRARAMQAAQAAAQAGIVVPGLVAANGRRVQ